MDSIHRKHAKKDLGEMRLREYEVVNQAWIKALLLNSLHGVLGSSYGEQPFVTPILYLYYEPENAIYFHGARSGRLRANLHHNPKVAFNVSMPGRLLAHQDASEFNLEYQSVTVFGTASVVEDQSEANQILEKLMRKYAAHLTAGQDYHPIQIEELMSTSVYRINIEEWTGKHQQSTDEYFEAYQFSPQVETD